MVKWLLFLVLFVLGLLVGAFFVESRSSSVSCLLVDGHRESFELVFRDEGGNSLVYQAWDDRWYVVNGTGRSEKRFVPMDAYVRFVER